MTIKTTLLKALTTPLLSSLVILGLFGCSKSPEQVKQERLDQLTKFSTTVTKHILDRDPATIKESVNLLLHGEVGNDTRVRLQSEKVIPDTAIDVLKLISDAETFHRVNSIEVTSAKPVSDITKDIVTMQVIGKETIKVNGKVDSVRPFNMQLVCRLTKEMDGYAQLEDVKNFPKTSMLLPPVDSVSKPKKLRRRG